MQRSNRSCELHAHTFSLSLSFPLAYNSFDPIHNIELIGYVIKAQSRGGSQLVIPPRSVGKKYIAHTKKTQRVAGEFKSVLRYTYILNSKCTYNYYKRHDCVYLSIKSIIYSRKNMHKAAPCPSTRIQYDSSVKNYMKKKEKEALSVQGYTTIICLCLFYFVTIVFFMSRWRRMN